MTTSQWDLDRIRLELYNLIDRRLVDIENSISAISITAADVPVTPSATLLSTNVQDALEELQAEILAIPTGVFIYEVTIATADHSYVIPDRRMMIAYELVGTAAQTVSLGTTALGSELGGPIALLANQNWVSVGAVLPSIGAQTLYFSGMTGTNNIKIWILGY